ncbi:unnamed protein product, partial [marine sediment metagenome]
ATMPGWLESIFLAFIVYPCNELKGLVLFYD